VLNTKGRLIFKTILEVQIYLNMFNSSEIVKCSLLVDQIPIDKVDAVAGVVN